ncbi:MAG: hypothetical protein PHE83_13255 [Opitutaceae bacterium]|nr:hypothetical protein [Opitutaceae bacterium]
MPRVQCSYCGLPFNVRQIEAGRAYYCCSGCALVSRLPAAGGGGEFPVTPALVAALGVGFALFNQVLFWTLAAELAREQRAVPALLFARISAGLGVLVWAVLATGIWRAPVRRWSDALVALATLGGLALAIWPPLSAGGAVASSAALGLWLGRGWGKQKFARKKTLPV